MAWSTSPQHLSEPSGLYMEESVAEERFSACSSPIVNANSSPIASARDDSEADFAEKAALIELETCSGSELNGASDLADVASPEEDGSAQKKISQSIIVKELDCRLLEAGEVPNKINSLSRDVNEDAPPEQHQQPSKTHQWMDQQYMQMLKQLKHQHLSEKEQLLDHSDQFLTIKESQLNRLKQKQEMKQQKGQPFKDAMLLDYMRKQHFKFKCNRIPIMDIQKEQHDRQKQQLKHDFLQLQKELQATAEAGNATTTAPHDLGVSP